MQKYAACSVLLTLAKALLKVNESNKWGRSQVKTVSCTCRIKYMARRRVASPSQPLKCDISFSFLNHQSFIRFLNSEMGGTNGCCCRDSQMEAKVGALNNNECHAIIISMQTEKSIIHWAEPSHSCLVDLKLED